MPELPEVETTVRGLRPVLAGRRLTLVDPRRADIRRAIPPDLRQRLTGATVTALGRRAKYGLIETDAGRRLALHDPRRFGSLDLVRSDALSAFPAFAAMGPEPLGADFTGAYLAERFAGRAAPVKALLLDQRIVAGLGNIYVCEALHMAGIAPARAAGRIARTRLVALVAAIRAVLAAAIEAGGSTLRDYAQPDGELGYFSKQFLVYGREGAPCACGAPVLRRAESGRSTFYCARCQR